MRAWGFLAGVAAIGMGTAGAFSGKEERNSASAEQIERGRQLFMRNWTPTGRPAFFNGRSCVQCHNEPEIGGSNSSPFNVVFFVPDDKSHTGVSAFPWLIFPRGQRLPFGDFEVRRPQPMQGMAVIESIPESEIIKRADPKDANKDGISGRFYRADGKLGRFGWKGNFTQLEQFTEDAFRVELGVAVGTGRGPNELTPEKVADVVAFTRSIPAPVGKPMTPTRAKGFAIFERIGCATCHTPKLKDESGKEVTIYSNLLLHDVDRGKPTPGPEGRIDRREFRTSPLWGLGSAVGPFWHDGSSQSIPEAIDRHEGEALPVRDRYRKLTKAENQLLMEFLQGL